MRAGLLVGTLALLDELQGTRASSVPPPSPDSKWSSVTNAPRSLFVASGSSGPGVAVGGRSPLYSILFLHPLKTGGSTLGGMFQRYAARHNSSSRQENCETAGETHCMFYSRSRKEPFGVGKFAIRPDAQVLNVASVRNPVDRVVSQFFQEFRDKDKSDCSTGAAHVGIVAWMKKVKTAANMQFGAFGGSSNASGYTSGMRFIDHLQLTDRLDEGLLLLHLRFRIPIWELLYHTAKTRIASQKVDTEAARQLEAQQKAECFPGASSASLSSMTRHTCTMAKEKAHMCRGLISAAMLDRDELRAIQQANVRDQWLWSRALERYEADRKETLARSGLAAQDLAKLVEAFNWLNHRYLYHQGCNATLDGRFECPSRPWLTMTALVPLTKTTPPSPYVKPLKSQFREVFSEDDKARHLAYIDGRRDAIQRGDEMLQRALYAS
jgi:hypothetical protein